MAESKEMIKIYSTKTCRYCKTVKSYYDAKEVKYTEIDLTTDNKLANEIAKKYKTMSVPLIVNDADEFTTGFNVLKLNHIAKTDGQL